MFLFYYIITQNQLHGTEFFLRSLYLLSQSPKFTACKANRRFIAMFTRDHCTLYRASWI